MNERSNKMGSILQKPYLQFLGNGKVFLNLPVVKVKKLKRINNHRYIGKIVKSERTFYTAKKYRAAHLFERYNSFAIPLDLIDVNNSKFDFICADYEKKKYWTSVYMLLLKGKTVEFTQYGFEEQIHLDLTLWKNTKAEAKAEMIKIQNGEITR